MLTSWVGPTTWMTCPWMRGSRTCVTVTWWSLSPALPYPAKASAQVAPQSACKAERVHSLARGWAALIISKPQPPLTFLHVVNLPALGHCDLVARRRGLLEAGVGSWPLAAAEVTVVLLSVHPRYGYEKWDW